MVSFDPISLVVEGISQLAIFFIDDNTKNQIEESKKVAEMYAQKAEESKEDAILYQLYLVKAKKQQEQTNLLTKQAIKKNLSVVYSLWFVFLLAMVVLFLAFKMAFGWFKKSV